MRPSRTASPAAFASGPTLTNHCIDRRGSIGSCGARVVADAVPVRALLRDDAALRAQRLADGDARLEPVHAVELGARAGDDARLVHDRRHRQAVPAADLEVVGVVRGGHLDRAGAERRVDVVVGEDRDSPADHRQLDVAADQVPVAVVVRVHDDGGVAQHRLDARGRDDDRVVAVAVADRDQLAVDLVVLDLDVGDHAAQRRRPVDHALGAVDQAVVEHPLEDGPDGAVEPVVHREALARPVDALAEPAHLDRIAPPCSAFHSHVRSRNASRPISARRLARSASSASRRARARRCDAWSMPGQVQRVVALHPAAADQHVDQRVLEGVPDVQAAGDVRRRDDDAERRLVALRIGLEVAALDPPLVQPALYLARDELGGEVTARWGGAGHLRVYEQALPRDAPRSPARVATNSRASRYEPARESTVRAPSARKQDGVQAVEAEHRREPALPDRVQVHRPHLPCGRLVDPPRVPVRPEGEHVVPRHERTDEQRDRPAGRPARCRRRRSRPRRHRPTCRRPAERGGARPRARGRAASAPPPTASCPAHAARTGSSPGAPASDGRRTARRTPPRTAPAVPGADASSRSAPPGPPTPRARRARRCRTSCRRPGPAPRRRGAAARPGR